MRLFVIAGLVCTLVACDDEGPTYSETYNCKDDTDHDDLLIGMTKTGEEGRLSYKLVDFAPAPAAIGHNRWAVEISTVAGVAPVPDASIDVYSFMPAHNHDGAVVTEIMPMATPGQYQLDPINLHMSGVWEVSITVASDAGDDSVVFFPCIPK